VKSSNNTTECEWGDKKEVKDEFSKSPSCKGGSVPGSKKVEMEKEDVEVETMLLTRIWRE